MNEWDENDESWDEEPDDKELSHLIDRWLSDVRPERYHSERKGWMDGVVDKVAASLRDRDDRDQVIYEAARRRVYTREGQATRRANKVLRDIAKKGALPLGWGDGDEWREVLAPILSLPLSLPEKKRVRFGSASDRDLEQWMFERIRQEDKRRLAEAEAREGARLLIEWLRSQDVNKIENLKNEADSDPDPEQDSEPGSE